MTNKLYALPVLIKTFFLILIFSQTQSALALTTDEIIDKAGQQRMLSQRITKAYILLGIQPGSEKGYYQMHDATRLFEENYQHIAAHDSAATLLKDLSVVHSQWVNFKALSKKPYSNSNAENLIKESNKLLKLAHAYVLKLQALTGAKSSELVGMSGKQRMLSQRIARNYLAHYQKLNGDVWLDRVYDDLAEYENAILYLREQDINTKKINVALRKVASNFRFITQGFDGMLTLSGERLVHTVISSTELMLYRMNEITKQYAAIVKDDSPKNN